MNWWFAKPFSRAAVTTYWLMAEDIGHIEITIEQVEFYMKADLIELTGWHRNPDNSLTMRYNWRI